MAFLFKFGKKDSPTNPPKNGNEESKSNGKKAPDMNLTQNKVNISTVYNKNEDYKPLANAPYKTDNSKEEKQVEQFKKILDDQESIDLEALKKLAWSGCPRNSRGQAWKVLLKYAPLNSEKRQKTIDRKREEYQNFAKMYYHDMNPKELDEADHKIFKLIQADVHRTQPEYPLFHHKIMQELMVRLLFVWHIRHPASGYVQGINDLVCPFVAAYMIEYVNLDYDTFAIPENFEKDFNQDAIDKTEADTYWCLCKILDGLLDNYTSSQQGTQKALEKIKDITHKLDPSLHTHLESKEIDYNFFSLRWIFCLLVREFPLKVATRLFDTYIADEQGFSTLHLYVCAALLLKWSVKLKKLDFAGLMMFLQALPTGDWSEKDIEMIISEGYVFMTLYEDSKGNFLKK